MKAPTDRQGEVLAFWASYTTEHGYPPSLRDLAAGLGLTSTNGAAQHVMYLIRKGYLQRPPGSKARSCTLTQPGRDWLVRLARRARRARAA